jgi:hypothetical protein
MIIVAGDSWGEGQWFDSPSHMPMPKWPGFHYYWTWHHGYEAINISYGGYSNHQAVSALDMHFAQAHCWKTAKVIIWLTCVLRDYPLDHEIDDMDSWTHNHYKNIFERLTLLSQRYDCEISILGGLGDIPWCFPTKLSDRVTILLHSTAKFVNPDYDADSPYGHFTLVDHLPAGTARQKVFAELEKKFDYMQARRDIYPDGGHFGRMSYRKLYEYVQSKI